MNQFFLLRLSLFVGLSLCVLSARAQPIDVVLPDTLVEGSTEFRLPVQIGDVTGLDVLAFQFTISYDSTVISIDGFETEGHLAEGFLAFASNPAGNRFTLNAARALPIEGQGILLSLVIRFWDSGTSDLVFENFRFGEGQPAVNTHDGRVRHTTLASRNKDEGVSLGFALYGNYPNPLRDETPL